MTMEELKESTSPISSIFSQSTEKHGSEISDPESQSSLPSSQCKDHVEEDSFNYLSGWKLHAATAGYVMSKLRLGLCEL